MKVKELIAILKKQEGDTDVTVGVPFDMIGLCRYAPIARLETNVKDGSLRDEFVIRPSERRIK